METALFRPVNDFRSPGRAPRCKPEEDVDDVSNGSASLLDESEEWAKVSNEFKFSYCSKLDFIVHIFCIRNLSHIGTHLVLVGSKKTASSALYYSMAVLPAYRGC